MFVGRLAGMVGFRTHTFTRIGSIMVLAICIVTTFAAIVVATAVAVFEKLLQNAIDMKSENDLTV